MKGSVNVNEERSERKRAHKAVHDFGLELFFINSNQLRSYETMDVFFSNGFGNEFGVLLLTRLVVIKRINELLIRRSILDLIDSAIERIVLDAD